MDRSSYKRIDSSNEDNSLFSDDSSNHQVIPYSISKYFPIPEGIGRDEFEFVQSRLEEVYRKSFVGRHQNDKFEVYYTSKQFVDFLSKYDIDKVECAVQFMKGRPELDNFLEKYGLDKSFKKSFVSKGVSINYLMTKFNFGKFDKSIYGKLNYNYLVSAMVFRLNHRPKLSRLLPKFQFDNLIQLCSEIELSMNDKRGPEQEFWSEYEMFWEEFGYDEIFTPWEYAKAFVENMIRIFYDEEAKIYNTLMLLRLRKSQMFGKFGDIDGMYYYLWAIDLAILHNRKWNTVPLWVINGLKMYGDQSFIENFCRINKIKLT